jgi:hypothetical protein
MRQDVSLTRSDCRNSSAEAKASAPYPNDRTSPLVASRKDRSSSTIDIIGTFDKANIPSGQRHTFDGFALGAPLSTHIVQAPEEIT